LEFKRHSHQKLQPHFLFATVPYKGRVNKLKPDQAEALRLAWKNGEHPSKVALAKAFGLSRQAVYRYLKI